MQQEMKRTSSSARMSSKRNGQEVTFDITKIINAIGKANHEVAGIHQMNDFQIRAIADNIAKKISNYPHAANVEDIQDMVETGIMEMRGYEVARNTSVIVINAKFPARAIPPMTVFFL